MELNSNAKPPLDDEVPAAKLVKESPPCRSSRYGLRHQARFTWMLGILGIVCPIGLLVSLRWGYYSCENARDALPAAFVLVLSGIAAVWALVVLIAGHREDGVVAHAVMGLVLNVVALPLGLVVTAGIYMAHVVQARIADQRMERQQNVRAEAAASNSVLKRDLGKVQRDLAKVRQTLPDATIDPLFVRRRATGNSQIVSARSGCEVSIVLSADGSRFYRAEYRHDRDLERCYTFIAEHSLPDFEIRHSIRIKGGSWRLSMCLCGEGLAVCADECLFGRGQSSLTILDPHSLQLKKHIELDGSCEVCGAPP